MRPLRYVPEGIRLVHVTCRTIQGRYLFTPSQRLNDIALGVFGRAQRMHPIRICEFVVMSSHVHILFDVDSVQQVADFMEYAGSNLAREVNRLTGWSGPVFERRYTMIPVSNEEAAQVEVLKYVIGHGVKEELVERVKDWPGIHSARARLRGEPLTGHWFSRKDEYAARRRGEDFDPLEYTTEETVILSPIPCWEHLPAEEYRESIRGLVEEVEEEAAADRERTGIPARGPEAILSQDPQHRPPKIAKSPAPFVHAATKAARLALYQSYSWFVGEFRKAAEKLRRGERDVGSRPVASRRPCPSSLAREGK